MEMSLEAAAARALSSIGQDAPSSGSVEGSRGLVRSQSSIARLQHRLSTVEDLLKCANLEAPLPALSKRDAFFKSRSFNFRSPSAMPSLDVKDSQPASSSAPSAAAPPARATIYRSMSMGYRRTADRSADGSFSASMAAFLKGAAAGGSGTWAGGGGSASALGSLAPGRNSAHRTGSLAAESVPEEGEEGEEGGEKSDRQSSLLARGRPAPCVPEVNEEEEGRDVAEGEQDDTGAPRILVKTASSRLRTATTPDKPPPGVRPDGTEEEEEEEVHKAEQGAGAAAAASGLDEDRLSTTSSDPLGIGARLSESGGSGSGAGGGGPKGGGGSRPANPWAPLPGPNASAVAQIHIQRVQQEAAQSLRTLDSLRIRAARESETSG